MESSVGLRSQGRDVPLLVFVLVTEKGSVLLPLFLNSEPVSDDLLGYFDCLNWVNLKHFLCECSMSSKDWLNLFGCRRTNKESFLILSVSMNAEFHLRLFVDHSVKEELIGTFINVLPSLDEVALVVVCLHKFICFVLFYYFWINRLLIRHCMKFFSTIIYFFEVHKH